MKQNALQILKGIHGIVKEDQAISRLLPQLGQLGLPYAQQAGDVAYALGYGRKKRAPARKRAPAKRRGRGVAPAANAELYSAAGALERRLGQATRAMDLLNLNDVFSSPPAQASYQRAPRDVTRVPSGRGRKTKKGKGFGDFLKGLVQAPLGATAALAGGLHGAVGGFGRKPRSRRAKI